MSTLFVVNNPSKWQLNIPNVKIIAARSYLTEEIYSDLRQAIVFNLCRSYSYQSVGYYVSLLASARGHKPFPSIQTIQDMKSFSIIRLVSDELEDIIQKDLAPLQSDRFTLSIYFGSNLAKRYARLSNHLFNMFQIPLMRAEFRRSENGWSLQNISAISGNDIPEEHHQFVIETAQEYFSAKNHRAPKRFVPRYDMAILYNPNEQSKPSNDKAIQKFTRAAKKVGIGVEILDKDDYGRIPHFDALFIRETTQVNHHTYRFSRRASAEGLVVIDDPTSIEKCTNKVFLAELLTRRRIPSPKTLIVHRDNRDEILPKIGLPCILKKPDSSFSQGVYKAEDEFTLHAYVKAMLSESDLIIAQEFLPTPFDWRVGIFDRRAIYVCKYFMASNAWKIMQSDNKGEMDYGNVETLAVENAPPQVVRTALRAANLIGDGLYGVDLKQVGNKVFVIEINDNPSIDSGFEDAVLKDALYDQIMNIFLKRIEQRKAK